MLPPCRKFILGSCEAKGFFDSTNEDISLPCHRLTFMRIHYQAEFGLPQWFPFVWFHSIPFAIIFIHCLMNYAKPVLLQSLGKKICCLFQRVCTALWLYLT